MPHLTHECTYATVKKTNSTHTVSMEDPPQYTYTTVISFVNMYLHKYSCSIANNWGNTLHIPKFCKLLGKSLVATYVYGVVGKFPNHDIQYFT